MKATKTGFLLLLGLCCLPAGLVRAAPKQVSISNQFIQVIVEEKNGRYIIKTVKGDPDNPDDDNKYLTFKDFPPTSFTTIALNKGRDIYRFGDGAGKFLKKPAIENDRIITVWKVRDVVVSQVLSFTNSPTTSRPDSVRINYRVENTGKKSQTIGVRVLIDTSLGEKDGVPFSIPVIGTVDNEQSYESNRIQQYWYSFDSLKKPKVRSMGTLSGPGTIAPDKIVFASWKKLSENPWQYRVEKGSGFSRSWFGARDTAVALYYNTRTIQPGYALQISTLYGMFGTDQKKGKVWGLSLGGSQLAFYDIPFAITSGVRNMTKSRLTNCLVTLAFSADIVRSVTNAKGKKQPLQIYWREMGPRHTEQIAWNFVPRHGVEGEYEVSVAVSGYLGADKYEAMMKRKIYINKRTRRKPRLVLNKEELNKKKKQEVVPPRKKRPFPDLSRLNEILRKISSIQNMSSKQRDTMNTMINAILKKARDPAYSQAALDKDLQTISRYIREVESLRKEIPGATD